MSRVFVHGLGAVSPAGWGVAAQSAAIRNGEPLPATPLARPGWENSLHIRRAPAPIPRPTFAGHPRLRRTSPLTHFAVAAALEAMGADVEPVRRGELQLGIVMCMLGGCVNYSRRFFDEAWRDPATASPLIFPETVFNAPASHLGAYLGTTAWNYTLVGDPGTFLLGISLAAHSLLARRVDACVVVGAEEADWITADAWRHFSRTALLGEGAGAIYLRADSADGAMAELVSITDPELFQRSSGRMEAAARMRAQLPTGNSGDLLADGLMGAMGATRLDAAEVSVFRDWPGARMSVKRTLGEGLAAGPAWQCVGVCDALRHGLHERAFVSVIGTNQQAIGAVFAAPRPDDKTLR